MTDLQEKLQDWLRNAKATYDLDGPDVETQLERLLYRVARRARDLKWTEEIPLAILAALEETEA